MKQSDDVNWILYNDSETIGTIGSEGGNIIEDYENINGARITLEENCVTAPFAVTLGIYGLMFHTHYDDTLQNAQTFILKTKLKINVIFDMCNVPDAEKNEDWYSNYNKLLEEIAELSPN